MIDDAYLLIDEVMAECATCEGESDMLLLAWEVYDREFKGRNRSMKDFAEFLEWQLAQLSWMYEQFKRERDSNPQEKLNQTSDWIH
jgi:hypothetical protein